MASSHDNSGGLYMCDLGRRRVSRTGPLRIRFVALCDELCFPLIGVPQHEECVRPHSTDVAFRCQALLSLLSYFLASKKIILSPPQEETRLLFGPPLRTMAWAKSCYVMLPRLEPPVMTKAKSVRRRNHPARLFEQGPNDQDKTRSIFDHGRIWLNSGFPGLLLLDPSSISGYKPCYLRPTENF